MGAAGDAPADPREVQHLPLDRCRPHPLLPEVFPDPERLSLLARSIRRYGVLCPILVRPQGRNFEVVAGRHRVAACRALGEATVPAHVRDLPDAAVLEIALLSQRAGPAAGLYDLERFRDLAFERPEASGDALAATLQADVADLRDRLTLAGRHPLVRAGLALGILTAAHADALRGVGDPARLFDLLARVRDERLTPEALAAAWEAP